MLRLVSWIFGHVPARENLHSPDFARSIEAPFN